MRNMSVARALAIVVLFMVSGEVMGRQPSLRLAANGRKLDDQTTYWDYSESEHGTTHWPEFIPTCRGKAQSPIDIPVQNGEWKHVPGILPKLNFEKANHTEGRVLSEAEPRLVLENTGKTVEVGPKGMNVRLNNAESLPYTVGRNNFDEIEKNNFKLEQFHFHWGEDDAHGSEHTLNEKTFPLEMHMVHFNTKYPNISVALNHEDGLLVVGAFFEVSVEDDVFSKKFFTPLRRAIVSEDFAPHEEIEIEDSLETAILEDLSIKDYYLYGGSLTTPPCAEVVTWILISEPLKVTSDLLAAFRQVTGDPQRRIDHNYRNVQSGNGRPVFSSRTNTMNVIPDVSLSDEESRSIGILVTSLTIVGLVAILVLGLIFMSKYANKE